MRLFFLAENAYMSFGLSGAVDHSQMMGADVAIAYMDGFRGYSTDYNITALSPVSMISFFKFHPETYL